MKTFQQFNEGWGLGDEDAHAKNLYLQGVRIGDVNQNYSDFITKLSDGGATIDHVVNQLIANFKLNKVEAGELIKQWVLRKK